jgi:3-methylcrotonyl-CoA carboxylase beta subunit
MSSKTSVENNAMQAILEKRNGYLQAIYEGGGKKAIAKQKEKNKLTARERIDYLIDKGSDFCRDRCFCRV